MARLIFVVFLSLMLTHAFAKNAPSELKFKFGKSPQSGIVAKIGSKSITEEDIKKGIETDLFESEAKIYDLKMGRLETIIVETLADKDPRSKGMTADAFLEKFITGDPTVSDESFNAFVKERELDKSKITPEVKIKIDEFIKEELKRKAVLDWVSNELDKTPVEIYLREPTPPKFSIKTKGSPFWGKPEAKVEIVEFTDFQCPYCRQASETVAELKKIYKDKIRVVLKNFPLDMHPNARTAAIAALCANDQSNDSFWALHDRLFEKQSSLSPEVITGLAKELPLNNKVFTKCLKSPKKAAQIDADVKEAERLGLDSVPTFFVNGTLVQGSKTLDDFKMLIDQEL